MLNDLEFAARRARVAARGATGHLRIGIFASIASGCAHEALRSFRGQYPHVEVEITEGEPRALLRQLRERELDIAFLTGRHNLQDLDSEVMWSESVFVVALGDHRVSSMQGLRWSDLRGERFIVSLQ